MIVILAWKIDQISNVDKTKPALGIRQIEPYVRLRVVKCYICELVLVLF